MVNPARPPARGLSRSSQGLSRAVGMGKRRRHSPRLEAGRSKDCGRCSTPLYQLYHSHPLLPRVLMSYEHREKQNKAEQEERKISTCTPLHPTLVLGRWRWGGRKWCSLPQASQEVAKGHRVTFYPCCPDSAHSRPPTDFSPVSSLPCPPLYPVN